MPNKCFISDEEIKWIEEKLSVSFTDDFKTLNKINLYDSFPDFEFYGFDSCGNYGIVASTLSLREIDNVGKNYIFAAQDDASMLLFEIQEDNMRVIWCGHEEFERLCNGEPMEEDYTIFETFADFYEYLLDEEEKRNAEE